LPSDLGVGVSVCIAAISNPNSGVPKIVSVVDRKASSGEFSNEDVALAKISRVGRYWNALFAGNDISPTSAIIRAVQKRIGKERVSVEAMMSAFESCYQEHLSSLATSLVLGRWRLTMEKFLDTGRKRFGADNFDAMWSQIQSIKLQCQFLVSGFDDREQPHVFVVRNPGVAELKDNIGYFAIGNGDFAAMSILGFLKQNDICSLAETFCHVWSAKFMAEGATDVGKISFGTTYGAAGFEEQYEFDEIEEVVREGWGGLGRPLVTQKTLDAVNDLIKKFEEKTNQADVKS
jgi:hypothetical protein